MIQQKKERYESLQINLWKQLQPPLEHVSLHFYASYEAKNKTRFFPILWGQFF